MGRADRSTPDVQSEHEVVREEHLGCHFHCPLDGTWPFLHRFVCHSQVSAIVDTMVSTVDDNSERLGGRHGPSAAQVVFFGNEFPSDDLKTLFRRLCQHSRDRRFRTLNAFLDVAAQTLKDEVAKLPQPARGAVPPFDSVLSLVEHGDFHPGPLGAAMESATLVAFQLSMLIGYVTGRDV